MPASAAAAGSEAGSGRAAASTSSSSSSPPASSSLPPPSSADALPLAAKDYTHYAYAPLYTGLAGVGLGTAVGSLRGHSPLLYALHMGIGYGVFGAAFSSTLYGLERVRGKEDTVNWVGAGAVAGGITSLLSGGKRKAMGGAVFFACLSVVAESVFELVGSSADDYRRRRALDRLQQPAGAPAAASSSSGGSPTK